MVNENTCDSDRYEYQKYFSKNSLVYMGNNDAFAINKFNMYV